MRATTRSSHDRKEDAGSAITLVYDGDPSINNDSSHHAARRRGSLGTPPWRLKVEKTDMKVFSGSLIWRVGSSDQVDDIWMANRGRGDYAAVVGDGARSPRVGTTNEDWHRLWRGKGGQP
nr:unnamed protein product [Digitaria exilis]